MTNLILPRRRLLMPAIAAGLAASAPALAKPALSLSPAIAERWEKAVVPAPSLMTDPALAMFIMAKMALATQGGLESPAPSTAKWNALDRAANIALSGGDYIATMTDTSLGMVRATISKSSGKWYFEGKMGGVQNVFGITTPAATLAGGFPGQAATAWGHFNGQIYNNGAAVVSGLGSPVVNDVIMVAVDFTNLKVWFGRNGTWFSGWDPATNTGGHTLAAGTYFPAGSPYNTTSAPLTVNFGAVAFAHTAPAGFLPWG